MKKLNYLLIITLCTLLSSCVYSLFPIYTKDTTVYLKELEGTWKGKEGGILVFSEMASTFSIEAITVTPGDDEFIVVEGDTIRDKAKVAAYWEEEMHNVLGPKMPGILDKKYILTAIENGDTINLTAVLAKIGENYFLDMSPGEGLDDKYIDQNLFPVHTFLKLEVSNDQLVMTQFDLDKLKDLFESNRIRLRHENVNHSVVITAQPEDIQKFLISYSKDESVFSDPDQYQRVIQ
ncbi:MAG: hypothetical protein CMB80_30230 [Flammeovirgaceae bacterium]|nr:hypothetical protein [Flammeovirgaceae bacterium]MBE63755.1 hypothetical protein [Flammeovirgaceae bacterium]